MLDSALMHNDFNDVEVRIGRVCCRSGFDFMVCMVIGMLVFLLDSFVNRHHVRLGGHGRFREDWGPVAAFIFLGEIMRRRCMAVPGRSSIWAWWLLVVELSRCKLQPVTCVNSRQ